MNFSHLYCVLVAMPVLMMARPAPNCCATLRAPTLVTQKLKIKIQRSVFSVRYCMRHNCAEQERRQRHDDRDNARQVAGDGA